MGAHGEAAVRAAFEAGAAGLAEIAAAVPTGAWDQPGLGEWTVRDLTGHAGRALSTIEAYLGQEPTAPVLDGPVAYFQAMTASPEPEARARQAAAVAERGRQAGAALGAEPAVAVAELVARVVPLVARTPGTAVVATPGGSITLAGYLPTRTFELAVHSLDLARALGIEPPAVLGPAVAAACELAGCLAARHPRAPLLLLSITGRSGLPEGLSVV